MPVRGRPPKTLEEKRRTGRSPGRDSGGRRLPEVAQLTPLRMADGTPEAPADLGVEGLALWERAWADAITWLSPESDLDQVEHACRTLDDLAAARKRYRVTTDPKDGRMVVELSKQLTAALSDLGFTPVSRSRLGVAEVRRVSKLEQLLADRQKRAR